MIKTMETVLVAAQEMTELQAGRRAQQSAKCYVYCVIPDGLAPCRQGGWGAIPLRSGNEAERETALTK